MGGSAQKRIKPKRKLTIALLQVGWINADINEGEPKREAKQNCHSKEYFKQPKKLMKDGK